jgi:galactarate dehydratase
VVPPGERARGKGLIYAATPASDFICGTLQLAAGMTLHVFTTGRGTPYGLAAVPVIKVATRSELAGRWHDLMDVDAGRIATGSATIEEIGWELFLSMLDVASGRRRTWTEKWKLHNSLALFNPAPSLDTAMSIRRWLRWHSQPFRISTSVIDTKKTSRLSRCPLSGVKRTSS